VNVIVVGLCGGSCSGKSTFSRLLVDALGEGFVSCLTFDDYYRPLDHLTLEERGRVNFDHPDSLDEELFIEHLETLRQGQRVQAPRYDFASHTRKAESLTVRPAPVVLADGILILHSPAIRALLDRVVFLDVPQDIRLRRRVARDTVERGRTEASVREQFARDVGPMHDRFVQPGMNHADLVIRHGDDYGFRARQLAVELRG
jgi:uridine kinase